LSIQSSILEPGHTRPLWRGCHGKVPVM